MPYNTILVINDGLVVESGTHDELLAKNGVYAGLYMSQFKNKEQEEHDEAELKSLEESMKAEKTEA